MPRQLLPAAVVMLAMLSLGPTAAVAQQAHGQQRPQPTRIGTFQNWIAAHTQEQGQKVCYAFARAARSEGGAQNRGPVTLTVTHRPSGRDQLALSAGFAFPRQAEAILGIGTQEFRSYAVVQSSAFFQSGPPLIAALRNGREAVARSPGPPGRPAATDTFPLAGFAAAHEAISRECPAPGGAAR